MVHRSVVPLGLDGLAVPLGMAVVNDFGATNLRIHRATDDFELTNPGFSGAADAVDWAYTQTGCRTICFAEDLPEALRLLQAHLALLVEPGDACKSLEDGTILTSMELACEGRLVLALTPAYRSSIVWAAFERADDPHLPTDKTDNDPAPSDGTDRGIVAWRLATHNLTEPHDVSRFFPFPGNAEAIASRIREIMRAPINGFLHNPFVFPDELKHSPTVTWKATTHDAIESTLTALAAAITGGVAKGRIEVEAAASSAGLPMGSVLITAFDGPGKDEARSLNELGFLLECLLIEWEPTGTALGLEDVAPFRQGIRRADFRDESFEIQVRIEQASAHEVLAATAAIQPILHRIAATKPWLTDKWFGRRCMTEPESAEGLLLGLMRRLA